jgi:hypothetical protein
MSMTRMKSKGDQGSPCLNPLWWVIRSPGTPFNMIRVDEVASNLLIMSHQIEPGPIFLITSIKKAQDTKSNALEISSLKRMWGCFCWWRYQAVCCTSMKLSWINHFFMKADWFVDIIPYNLPANRFARILVTSLAKECTKLIRL